MSVELPPIEELERELAVREARDQRNRALGKKRERRRATRARIILGGAVLAEIREHNDPTFIERIVSILNDRVPRSRDRDDLTNLLGVAVPDMSASPGLASVGLPDFSALTEAALKPLKSVALSDPKYHDVRDMIEGTE